MAPPTREGTLIVGAGVVGLGIGWKLAQRGEPVTVLERGAAGREASWAAAGMLAPATEVHYQEDTNLGLGLESMRLYPDFVAELEALTGESVDYRTEGALAVAMTADEAADLKALFEYQLALGLPVRWMSADAARELEPSLTPQVTAAVLCGMDHQIDNRRLVQALKTAFLKSGGSLREHCEVTHVDCSGGGFRSVRTPDAELRARRVVIAAGSWSGMLPGLPEEIRPPVRPVKGQILSLRMPNQDFLRHMVRAPHSYLAPKNDGRLIVGATVEEMGFDRSLTAGGLYSLLRGAWETLPVVYELPIQEMWAGFRPGSRDNAPMMGESSVAGVFMATGHHRNGILFTPATATYMSQLLLEGTVADAIKPFSPQRFSASRGI